MQGTFIKEFLCMCTVIYIDTYIHMYVGQTKREREQVRQI